jgi:type IV pilus assembly protein PilB
MKIGELLIMNGLLSQEQLDEALQLQLQQSGKPRKIGEILTKQGWITEQQLVEALEFQLGFPAVSIREIAVDREVLALVEATTVHQHRVLPLSRKGGKLRLAMQDPLDKEAIAKVQATAGISVQPVLVAPSELEAALTQYYGQSECDEELFDFIKEAVELQATDMILEPASASFSIRYRVNRSLSAPKKITISRYAAFMQRIKVLSGLSVDVTKLPQSGRFEHTVQNQIYEIRVTTLPTLNGERLQLTPMVKPETNLTLSDLGWIEAQLQQIQAAADTPSGLIVISGPDGGGKTTTAYALLEQKTTDSKQVFTIERNISRKLNDAVQVTANEETGLPFLQAIYATQRQHPDVLLMDELREAESLRAAVSVARNDVHAIGVMSGDNVRETLAELLRSVQANLLAEVLRCIVSVRCVRSVCTQCAQSISANEEEMRLFEAHDLVKLDAQEGDKKILGNFRTLISGHFNGKVTVVRGNGCRLCNQTGYRGQTGICEVLPIDDTLRQLLTQERPFSEIDAYLQTTRFKTLLYNGLYQARIGKTTVEEVMRAIT